MQNTAKQNYPGSVAFYDTRSGNEMGLFYNASESTWGTHYDAEHCHNVYNARGQVSVMVSTRDMVAMRHDNFKTQNNTPSYY